MNIWQRFKEWCVKKMIPSADTLAGIAADGITNGFNRQGENTRDKIAKIAVIGETASKVTNKLTAMLTDGKIDEGERDEIAAMLTPLFAKVLDTVR